MLGCTNGAALYTDGIRFLGVLQVIYTVGFLWFHNLEIVV